MTVNNLAVFLSNSKQLARAFGENRAEYGQRVNLLTVKLLVSPEEILDLHDWGRVPSSSRRRATELTGIRQPGRVHLHRLLDDPEFVIGLIVSGYKAATFTESPGVIKEFQIKGKPLTYAVFDLDGLHIYRKPFETIQDVGKLL